MRLLVPETIQTSSMDCGPAALASLLAGFGIDAAYPRLRDLCLTDVDGTSIDELEAAANDLGLDATQTMLPPEHVALASAQALPALLVVTRAGGVPHFVIAWRRHGRFVQVMDPGVGRRWMTAAALQREMYVHELDVPTAAWSAYAASDVFRDCLRERLRSVGAAHLLECADGWQALAALDAGLRAGLASGALAAVLSDPAGADLRPDLWTARPGADGGATVRLRGAVLVSVRGRKEQAADLPPEARAALETPAERPWRRVLAEARRTGRVPVGTLSAAVVIAGAATVVQAILLRDALRGGLTWAAADVAVAVTVALLVCDVALGAGLLMAGRRIETGLQRALLHRLPRLPDGYLRSRPPGDLAERAHLLAELRALPVVAGHALRSCAELVALGGAIVVLYPAGWPAALGAVIAVAVAVGVAQFPLRERELRVREHAGGLAQFTLDALRANAAARAHDAARALATVHRERLAHWRAAELSAARTRVVATALQLLIATGLAVVVVVTALPHVDGDATRLLVVLLAVSIPVVGERIALLGLQLPLLRATALRLFEPLGAQAQVVDDARRPRRRAPRIELDGVTVRRGRNAVLARIHLDVAPREHVAVVGASGSGKSSLIATLLGFLEPSAGDVRVDGTVLDPQGLAELRASTAWLGPDVRLWNRTLADNAAYGGDGDRVEPRLQEAELDAVTQRVGLAGESLWDDGGLLSGGERQRVRLARALGRRAASLVLLDEPFRGLDGPQRQRLLARVRRDWAHATLICVTHDVAQAAGFDRVLVLDSGRLVEAGPPAELLADAEGVFARLVRAESELHAVLDSWRHVRIEGGRLRAGISDTMAVPVARPAAIAGLCLAYLALELAHYGLFLGSWAVVGRRVLDGEVGGNDLVPWALLLLAAVPVRSLAVWVQGRIGLAVATRLQVRLLDGALGLDHAHVRREGPARLLGHVLDADALARLAPTGGLMALVAAIELAAAGVVLLALSGVGPVGALLGLWMLVLAALTATALHRRRVWNTARLAVTEVVVDATAGQRTRLVQGGPADRPVDDARLAEYAGRSRGLDRSQVLLSEVLPNAWLLAALGVLIGFGSAGTGALAAALGAILLVHTALLRAGDATASLSAAWIALEQVRPILAAVPARDASAAEAPDTRAEALVADGLVVERGGRPVAGPLDLVVRAGERLVLDGPSGAGKSTLAGVLSGALPAAGGTLTLTGRPLAPDDPRWRAAVVHVPQGEDNHLLLAPVAVNALLGRGWPPADDDLDEARQVLVDLGLGPTLDAMPAGPAQLVGDTGWQLSDGERSLLHLARALLQDPDVVILDESIGPLDPATALRALRTIEARSRAVVLIAHRGLPPAISYGTVATEP